MISGPLFPPFFIFLIVINYFFTENRFSLFDDHEYEGRKMSSKNRIENKEGEDK